MFGIGPFELLAILLVGVMVLGPEKLPKVMRTVTKWMSEFRRISTDIQRTINAEINLEEMNRQHKKEREEFGVKFIQDEVPSKAETPSGKPADDAAPAASLAAKADAAPTQEQQAQDGNGQKSAESGTAGAGSNGGNA